MPVFLFARLVAIFTGLVDVLHDIVFTREKVRVMIRFVLGLFIFAVVLCAYIVNSQHGGILPQRTAADTATTTLVAPIETTEDRANAEDAAAAIISTIVTPDLDFDTTSVPVGAAVRDTLALLGLEMNSAVPSGDDQRFARLVGEALKIGTSDTEIIAIVTNAARAGDVAIPEGLVRVNGQIDTETFLKAVVNSAVLTTENAQPVAPDLSNDPTAIITVDGYDYAITERDSLAAIAIKFYGDIMQTERIIRANPVALARPAHLKAGTVIAIPTF